MGRRIGHSDNCRINCEECGLGGPPSSGKPSLFEYESGVSRPCPGLIMAAALCWVSVACVTALGNYAVVYSLRQTTSPARPELLSR